MPARKGSRPLSKTHPKLAREADGWDPYTLTHGSHKRVRWKCKLGHSWVVAIKDRVQYKTGCPVCSGKKVLAGFNDLATTDLWLANQANGWDPRGVSRGSHAKVSWKCEQGHTWQAVVKSRALQALGCPVCSNHLLVKGTNDLATTHPKLAKQAAGWDPSTVIPGSSTKKLWRCQKGHTWSAAINSRVNGRSCPFCANKKLLRGFNDLATTHPHLVSECDGWDPREIITGSNSSQKWICSLGHRWSTPVVYRTFNKSGCPYCSGHQVLTGFNDLATTHPHLVGECDGWDPRIVSAGSNKKFSWICSLGHAWSMSPNNRKNGQNCPTCANRRILIGFNDLASTHPQIAAEASGWDPKKVSAGSGKKLKWQCLQGHHWTATPTSRVRGTGCPSCTQYGYDPNQDAWLYLLENKEWDLLQVGKTNNLERRLSEHAKFGWDLIDLRGPLIGELASTTERSMLHTLFSQPRIVTAVSANLKDFTGFTESWLKSSYPVKSLKEILDLVHQMENQKS